MKKIIQSAFATIVAFFLLVGLAQALDVTSPRVGIPVDSSSTPTKYVIDLPLTTTTVQGQASATTICLGNVCYSSWPAGGGIGTTTPWSTAGNYLAVVSSTGALASVPASGTYTFWIDGNRGDNYTPNGSINFPYKTFSAALSAAVGLPSYSLFVAPGTYVEGSPLSFPSGTFQLIGNESTLVVPSGVTFTGPYDVYDLTVSGNTLENDTSTTNSHQWENSIITGNFTVNGLTTFTGDTFPTKGTVITVATGTNLTAINDYFANSFNVQGMANLDGIGIFASTTSPVVKVTSGGQLTMNGGTVFNYGGPGIDVSASGATSTPNEISNVSIVVSATSTTSTVYCGTSQCLLSDLATLSDLTGGFHPPSGTAWTTSYNENKNIFNAFSFGTSTMTSGQATVSGNLAQSNGAVTLSSTTINGSATTTGNAYTATHVNAVVTSTATTSSTVINWALGNEQVLQLQTSTNLTYTGCVQGEYGSLDIYQDGTGSRTVLSWPSTGSCQVNWLNGEGAPTLPTAINTDFLISVEFKNTSFVTSTIVGRQMYVSSTPSLYFTE